MNQEQEPIFNKMEFREIAITYMNLVIKGFIKNSQALKEIIINSREARGINQEQEKALIDGFKLSGETNSIAFTKKEIIGLLDNLLKEQYIAPLDYFISLSLGVNYNILDLKNRLYKLNSFKINPNLISKEELKQILKDLEKL